MQKLKITLVKSLIGSGEKQKLTAQSLGLRKIGDDTLQTDDAVLGGKVKILSHLIKVEKIG